MPEDFKQNYISEQKKQEAARSARLARIGMGSEAASVKANAAPNIPPRAPAPEYTRPSAPAQPQRTPAAHAQRPPVQPQRTPAAQAQRPTVQSQRTPAAQMQRSAAQPQRPAAQPQRASEPVRRPAPNASQTRGSNVITASPASQRRPVGYEEKQFKQKLSDDESRAMMFALTGKAEQPSYGGDVDVIDIGKVSSGRSSRGIVREKVKKKSKAGTYVGRFFTVLLSLILFVVLTAYVTIFVIAHGPSESMRDLLVQSAEQASATKWVPYLVLSKDTVHEIINRSEEVVQDEISIDDYKNENGESTAKTEDEWANAKDGVIFETINGSTYKAYVMLVKDPSRVFVGTSTDDFSNATAGVNIFQAADRYGALACINGGEFLDNGGHGSGYAPLGLTFSKGECVFNDGSVKTFMGFTSDNKLIVRESMTAEEAKELGIRDAVSFQNGNTLIEKNGDKLVMYYADGNTGTSQRSAIGQSEDGTVILIVTDGRTASSPGATHNDMIDLMVSYGAVSAGMLDGGSSAMMYYRDYYDKYDIDKSTLDQYQLQGLVNNYKAFTEPRRIPTFFMVSP